jgi:hypothetical protein
VLALKMESAIAGTSFNNNNFEDYSPCEQFSIIQQVEKYKREKLYFEGDVDVCCYRLSL